MFRLPVSTGNGVSVLCDRTAVSLLTAHLSDDLDDRIDIIREALRLDSLLACWAVQEASLRQGVELRSLHATTRWLERYFLEIVFQDRGRADSLVYFTGVPARKAWGSVALTALRAARNAEQIATRNGASVEAAFWNAMLCCTKRQLESLSRLNGSSPLHGVRWSGPAWMEELDVKLMKCGNHQDPAYSAQQAVELTSSMDERWLADDEAELLSCDLPDVKRLVSSMLKKLHRLRQLETQFAEQLHQEKMAAMQQLAYGASHEINNPLANISTRAQSLMQHEHDADRRRKLLAINSQAFRAYEMIADLMLFAKPPKLDVQSVCVQDLLGEIRAEVELLTNDVPDGVAHKPLICQLRSSEDQIRVAGDPTHLSVAIKAVCVNGVESMGGQGELIIEVSVPQPGFVDIAIEDSGKGLSELAQRHLFDPFFSGREAGRGMGFGLSKAWRIIQEHRGRIDVRSDPSRGSRFTITLPTERVGSLPNV